MLVDESVQDKRYSRFIEGAKRQYSGTMHSIVTGIGLVNLVHSNGEAGDFLPLDFLVYAPAQDQLTKNDHFQAMFRHVMAEGKLQARTLLFDCWYAGSANLKLIHRAGWTFFHHPEKQPLGERPQTNGLLGPRHARTAGGGLERRSRSAAARSALCGALVQVSCHRRQH